jgi:threonine dehydrogenase-like Zn-dependent dehydrogenase
MATIQELTFIRKGRLEWREVPCPRIGGPKEALVRPIVAARCDGDGVFLFHDVSRVLNLGVSLHLIDPAVRELGTPPLSGPFPYGHECIGEVVEVGDDVTTLAIGQPVIVPWSISCGACATCGAGLTSHCERKSSKLAAYGFGGRAGGWGGAVSDLLRVPHAEGMLVPLPAGLSPVDLASASDNIPDAWRTVGPHLKLRPGSPVLVVGGRASSIGLYAAGIAVAMGSSQVDYVDWDRGRLTVAASLGAHPIEVNRPARWFGGAYRPRPGAYPIVVDASSRERGLQFAVRAVAPGGVCTTVGYYFRKGTPLPLWHMYLNGTRLHVGVSNARADLPAVLDLVARGKFRPQLVSTVIADWDQAAEAILDRDAIKVVVARKSVFAPGPKA